MAKDIRVAILMILFPCFFYCCTSLSIETKPVAGVPAKIFRKAEVVAVELSSGDVYRFSESHPAKIVEDQVKGEALERREIPLNQITKLTKDKNGKILEIVDTTGTSHKLALGKIENETLIAYFDELPFQSVSLLFSKVIVISYKKSVTSAIGVVTGLFLMVGTFCLIMFLVAASQFRFHM